jgi:ketosteroid isomerase-like protein
MLKRFVIFVGALTALFAPSYAGAADSAAVAAIRAADTAWAKDLASKNMTASLAALANGGTLMAPNNRAAYGKLLIKKGLTTLFKLRGLALSRAPEDIGVADSGELGYSSGTYALDFIPPAGKPVHDRGKYATVWKKQPDGSWKVYLDIFNSDLPAK